MDELEKLVALLERLDASLKENETVISKMKEDISNIKDEELALKKLYPDLCEVEQIRTNIEMNRRNMEECGEDDKDTAEAFEQKIESLQNSLTLILEKLQKSGIRNKKEYQDKMNDIKERKSNIPNTEEQINQKEQEMEKLRQEIKSTQEKIEKIKEAKKSDDVERKTHTENTIDFVEDKKNQDDTKGVLKRDLTKKKNVGKTSEIASFIGYEEEPAYEEKEEEIKAPKKKEYSIDYLVDNLLRKQDGIKRKFEEILQESKDDNLNKNVIYLKNKFEQKIYNSLSDASNKFINKRKEINNIRKELENYTGENEEQRLKEINDQLVDEISQIQSVELEYQKEIINDFNSFKDFVKKESDSLYELKEDVKNKIDDVESKVSSIDNKFKELKENSKESILEAIKKVDHELEEVNNEQKDIEQDTKDVVADLLERTTENVKESYDYKELVSVIDNIKQKIDKKMNETSDKISQIEEKRAGLESGRRGLEEKYNIKRKNDDDKEEKDKLLNQKEELKQQAKSVVEQINILKGKSEKLRKKSDEEKLRIKSNIKRKDMEVSNKKKEALERANAGKKSPAVRLREGVDEYNNEYIGEFERYVKKIQGEIDEIQKENDEYKKGATNIVVVSEFEENFQLFSELRKMMSQIIESNKVIENQIEAKDYDKSSIRQEIEQNVSKIKPEDTINSKIDFGEIYEMEDKAYDVDTINQSAASLCKKLGVEMDVVEQEIEQVEEGKEEKEIRPESKVEPEEQMGQECEVEPEREAEQEGEAKQEGEMEQEKEEQMEMEEQTKREEQVGPEEETKPAEKEKPAEEEKPEREEKQAERGMGQQDRGQDRGKDRREKRSSNMAGLEEYSDNVREVLLNIPWSQLMELKNMNKEYQKILYFEDLKELKNEKVQNIAKLKEQYKAAVEYAKKLYEVKKYVLAYKKGMEEMAKGSKGDDKEAKKEYSNIMKIVGKSVKVMKENGISGFEDFRDKVIKNSDAVKEILAKTKNENEELVRLMGLIQSIQRSEDMLKSNLQI